MLARSGHVALAHDAYLGISQPKSDAAAVHDSPFAGYCLFPNTTVNTYVLELGIEHAADVLMLGCRRMTSCRNYGTVCGRSMFSCWTSCQSYAKRCCACVHAHVIAV